MGKIIVRKAVKRKPGYLYYVDGIDEVCCSEIYLRIGRND